MKRILKFKRMMGTAFSALALILAAVLSFDAQAASTTLSAGRTGLNVAQVVAEITPITSQQTGDGVTWESEWHHVNQLRTEEAYSILSIVYAEYSQYLVSIHVVLPETSLTCTYSAAFEGQADLRLGYGASFWFNPAADEMYAGTGDEYDEWHTDLVLEFPDLGVTTGPGDSSQKYFSVEYTADHADDPYSGLDITYALERSILSNPKITIYRTCEVPISGGSTIASKM
jgi:hypothetical protein